jgi:PAS domain S-box-containing protein
MNNLSERIKGMRGKSDDQELESSVHDLTKNLIDGEYTFQDLVDIDQLRSMFEQFSQATGFTTGLVTYPDQELLIGTGWRDICTKFHRTCPASETHCKQSNLELTSLLKRGKQYNIRPCDNGLVDGATPVIIEGTHVASLASGQILFNHPDIERFKKQAEKYDFNTDAYLEALKEVPVVTEDEFVKAMKFLSEMAVMLAEQGLKELNNIKAKEALHESEKKFRSVIEQSNDGIYILFNDRFDLMNKRFTELTGITIEEAKSSDFNFMDSIAPKDRPLIEERKRMRELGEKLPSVYEFWIIHKNGQKYYVQASITDIDYLDGKAVLGILRDISEQKTLEDQLRQAQKIESVGHLTSGIAHDFNNLLTPIIGNSELAIMDMESSNPLHKYLYEIRETASRAADLTRQLLAFSRKQDLEMKIVDINVLIENFSKILRRTIREDIKIELKYGSSIGLVHIDVSQIEQILMNLTVNAQDAMQSGGVIVIETDSMELDQKYSKSRVKVVPGQYVVLAVSDTGEGIDKDVVQKIFDPFFTTKGIGKGTGLGLSTVHGIIKQHGGHIWVYSEPGRGTTFKLCFPLVQGKEIDVVDPAAKEDRSNVTGTILLVEDEEQVRRTAARILQSKGHTVITASSGEEAISILKSQKVSIDMLLSDVIMPDMNGKELSCILNEIQPDLKVLFMSGYTQSIISHHGVFNVGINFIQKPLTVEALANKVNEVLES